MFTAYYILAVSFGVSMALISLYAIKFRLDESFPGKFYVPLMIIGALFAVSTLAAVIHGGNEEVEHRKHEQEQEAKEAASLPAPPAGVILAQRN